VTLRPKVLLVPTRRSPLAPHPDPRDKHSASPLLRPVSFDEGERSLHNRVASVLSSERCLGSSGNAVWLPPGRSAHEAALNPLLLRAFPEALPSQEALSSNQRVKALTFAMDSSALQAGDTSRLGWPVGCRFSTRLPWGSFRQASRLWQCCRRSGTTLHHCSGS
jgi:hypothetical protein